MNKKELLKKLQESSKNKQVRFPRDIDFALDKQKLTIKLHASELVNNMQTDSASFEGWAIVLKYYISEISQVVIDWENAKPRKLKNGNASAEQLHYNRFLFRLAKFVETYHWASVKPGKNIPIIPKGLLCNYPTSEPKSIDEHVKKMKELNKKNLNDEYYLECDYVIRKKDEYDIMNHQLPVGLFVNKVSAREGNAYTTGRKGAIDIWAIKDSTFYIFELKKPDNKKLGIISELMFYTNVVAGLLSHEITYDVDKVDENYRGFLDLYNAYKNNSIKKINAVMLADNLHPLINDKLIDFINDSNRWKELNICFSHKTTK